VTDRILTEAYAKLTAIEEADHSGIVGYGPGEEYVPMSRQERDRDAAMHNARSRSGEEDSHAIGYPEEFNSDLDESIDDIHTQTIDFLDDMLDELEGDERYGHKSDLIRYAITRLQQVGIGR
jgi:hypothetical protein